MVRVLFVCLGNICRSPTAEGVLSAMVQARGLEKVVHIDSAGTHAYHIGKAPDIRSQQAAARRGIDLSMLVARRVARSDFETFDYILAMDNENLDNLLAMCPDQALQRKISLFLRYAPHLETREVPDPYYGGDSGFERVLDLVDAASAGLLADIERRHLQR
ncbi:MAG: low molecular weight phosphotyrosine protein phosphatase [Gammaproteobacteria bacterium]|nr:low molecular weight phosphotyrosine protein phosphatase [Gammaproteobacteria bacterium]